MSMVDPGFGNAIFFLFLIVIGCLLDRNKGATVYWNGETYEQTWRGMNG